MCKNVKTFSPQLCNKLSNFINMPEAFLLTYSLFENSIWKSVIKLNLQIKLYKQSWIWNNMMSLEEKPVGKGSFVPTKMENTHILRTKQNKNILRLFFSCESKVFDEGIFFCLEISQCFKLGWVHWVATSVVVACKAPLALWREDGELELVQFWRGGSFVWWCRWTQCRWTQCCMVGRQDSSKKLIKNRFSLGVREAIFTYVQRGCDVSALAYFQQLVG